MLDDFLEGLSTRWQEFLDWSDEKGLPLRGVSDSLEQNGIPPAPFFLGLLIIVVCAIGFVAYSNMAPSTGTITIRVQDLAGVEVSGADVMITSIADRSVSFSNLSNMDGVAVFVHVPLAAYNVSISSANYKAKYATVDISESLSRSQTVKLEEQPVNANATVAVNVDGVTGSVIPAVSVKNSLLTVVGSKQGKSVYFSLPKSASYTIIVNAEGYTQNSTAVQVGSEDPAPVSIYLYPVADETTVDVIVQLTSAATNTSFNDAAIKVLTSTGLLLRSLNPDAEGKAPVKLAKGESFRFVASLEGYDEATLDYTASPAVKSVKIALSKPGSDGAVKTACTVVDEAGNKAGVATVNLYLDDKKVTSAKTVADGLASFSLLPAESYWVTAYKSKYLPTGAALTAGADCRLVLTASTKENAAKVKVKVTDEADGLISGASVALFGADGALGLPEATTGSDGAADFSDVPLSSVYAFASAKGRSGYSEPKGITVEGEEGKNYTTLTARLLPQQGTLKFRVIDRFSRKAITGATVDASTTESGSCTTITGTCSVDVLEGWGYFKVAAPGYSSYSSAQVQVVPNVEKEVQVELLASSIAENVKAVFLGLYDLSGNKVSSLEPSTTYNAKFLVNAPDMKFSKAALHVRLGTTAGDASTLNAYISGYDGGTDASTSGGDSYGVSSAVANTSALDSVENAYDSASNSIEYKWAELSYPSFAGTKEAYVQVTTRQVRNGTVLLGFRTAYTTVNGTLRDPSDDSVKAGQEQLAAVNVTKYSISFGGVCSDDQCLEAKVESTRGEYSKNFEATIPEVFTLTVKSISQNGPYDIRVVSNSNKTVNILSGSSPSGAATITNQDDGQLALVPVPSGNVDASFTIKALRISDALSFSIEADYEGEKVNGLDLSGRIISASNNALTVGVSPSYISALSDNTVTFMVTDAFGTPIEDAHVAIGSKTDIFGDPTYEIDGSGEENAGKDGKYLLEGVYPDRIGNADFTVASTGYAEFYGALPATARKIVEVSPTEAMDLLVDSKEGNSDSITVSNLLENAINVRSTVVLDKTPKITSTLLSESSFSLEASESRELLFDTWILDSVLDVAKSTRTLSENFSGRIIIEARAGSSSRQKVTIPFKVYSAFVQRPLDDYWGVDQDSVELTLYMGSDNTTTASLEVYNTMSNNLLVNYQLDSANDWLSFSPASLVLGPSNGEAGQIVLAGEEEVSTQESTKNLSITATMPSGRKALCVMENNGQVTTNLTLVASINGIRSERKVPVTLNLQSDVDCVPDNAVDVLMPLGMKVALSAKTLKKENEDGSIAVQEPSKDNTRVVFGGASLSDSKTAPYVTAPSGSTISAAPAMAVIIKPQEEFSLALPYVTTYYVNSYVERANNPDASTSFTLDSGDIVTFPAGTQIGVSTESLAAKSSTGFASAKFSDTESTGTTQVGVTAKVLAYSAVNFKTEGSSAACTSAVSVPKSGTIYLPSGTQITTGPSGEKEAALPDCSSLEIQSEDESVITLPAANKIVLPDGSDVSRDRQAQTASVPARSEMQVSYCSQTAKDTYTATFGEDVAFHFSENKKAASGTIKFGSCQQIVTSNGYTLPPATAISFDEATEVVTEDSGYTAVNVYAGNKVTFASCACTDAKSGKVRLTQGVAATSGSALTLNASKVEFTLTDGALTATDGSICVSNTAAQSLNVSAKAINFPAVGIIANDDLYFGGEYRHSGVLAASKDSKTCSALTIKAKVPDTLLDSYGCVKSDLKQQTYEGKVKLTARTLSGVAVSEQNTPEISVKVTIKKGKCEARDMGLSETYLKDIFVNYDSTLTDVKTGVKRVFAFKNGGHTRPLLIVNNRLADLSLSYTTSDPNLVNCASVPETVKRSDAVSINCVSSIGSGSATGKQALLTFTFKDGTETIVKTVRAIVYSTTDTTLYSSSPLGDMLPLERKTTAQAATVANAAGAGGETASFAGATASPSPSPSPSSTAAPATAPSTPVVPPVSSGALHGVDSVADCTTHFCTYDQSVAAYTKFVGNMRQVIDYIGKDEDGFMKRLDTVCNANTRGTGNEYSKVMIMQVANMNQTFDFLNSVAQAQFSTVTNNAGMPAFDGCGVYKIIAKPQFCITKFTSAAEFKAGISIDVAAYRVGEKCPETLANSMLLLGNDPELYGGNELTKGAGEIPCALEAASKGDILSILGGVKIGIYKDKVNAHDEATANALMKAGFGINTPLTFTSGTDANSRVKAAIYYDDLGYCAREGGALMLETAGALSALDAVLLFSGGESVQAATALTQTLVGAIATTATSWAGGRSPTCAAMCALTTSAIGAQANLLMPGEGVLLSRLPKEQVAETLLAALTGGSAKKFLSKEALSGFVSANKEAFIITGAGAGINLLSGGSASSLVTRTTGAAVGGLTSYNLLLNKNQQLIRSLMQKGFFTTRAGAEGFVGSLSAATTDEGLASKLLVSSIVDAIMSKVGDTRTKAIKFMADDLQVVLKPDSYNTLLSMASSSDTAALRTTVTNSLDDLVSAGQADNVLEVARTTTIGRKSLVSGALQMDDYASEAKTVTSTIGLSAESTAVKAEGISQKVTSRMTLSNLRTAGVMTGMIVALLMMDCDVRPTEALLDPSVLNHFVIYTKKRESNAITQGLINQPSMTKACFASVGSDYWTGGSVTEKPGSCVNLEDSLCPNGKGYSSCVAFAKSGKVDGLQGYTLFLSTDEKFSTDYSVDLFKSLFVSTSKPLVTTTMPVYRRVEAIMDNGDFTFINS